MEWRLGRRALAVGGTNRVTRMMKMNDVRITILDGSPDHTAESINHGEHVDDSSVI